MSGTQSDIGRSGTDRSDSRRAASFGDEPKRLQYRRSSVALTVTAAITLTVVALLLTLDLTNAAIGGLVIVAMLGLMLLHIPIGIAMIVAACLGLYVLIDDTALAGTLAGIAYTSFASWSLSVIPMFILMGIAMSKSGLTVSAYSVAQKWFGRLPGGLAIATNFAGAGLAASSGSSIGITYAIGKTAIPEMLRAGYKPSLAAGSVAMSGTLGQVIPPSVLLVIYAGVAQVPVGPQLLAGIVPGMLLAALFTLVIVVWVVSRPSIAPTSPLRYTWADKFSSLVSIIPIVLIVVAVIGGMYLGFFTSTEAGAFGAILALIFGTGAVVVAHKSGRAVALKKFITSTISETVSSVASIFLLLVGVLLLTRVLALTGLTRLIADFVTDLGLTQLTFLLCLIPVYLILGFFLDTLAMMLLTIPIFIGPLQALDVDLIWFGIFLVVLAEIDMVAPPLGVLNFVVHSITNASLKSPEAPKLSFTEVSITEVFRGVTPFIIAAIAFLVALILWPELATWLPSVAATKE